MELNFFEYDYNKIKNFGTGSHNISDDYKIETIQFGKYEIKVILTPYNEFIGIAEIALNKDFLSYEQKIAIKGFHDVDDLYPE